MTLDPFAPLPCLKGTPGMVWSAYPIRLRWWNYFLKCLAGMTPSNLPAKKLSLIAHIDWMFRSEPGRDSTFWLTELCPDFDFKTFLKVFTQWHEKKCSPLSGEEGEVEPD